MTNINPKTGIAYGYISGSSLDQDLLQLLQDNGVDLHYKEARQAAEDAHVRESEEAFQKWRDDNPDADESEYDSEEPDFDEDKFNDSFQDEEPVHSGTFQNVQYQTSWLGGAMNVWIFESPHITEKARRASPCVPGAGILDTLDGDVQCYNVPDDWRHAE